MDAISLEQAELLYSKPAYVQTAGQSETTDQLIEKHNQRANDAAIARLHAIKDSAMSVGIKTGLAWQIKNINRAISKNQRTLDTVYDFSPMMIHDRVVPPVISEARDLYNQSGSYALRLSGAHYRIESQARFASNPPVWREYLTFAAPDTNRLSILGSIAPKTEREREIWRAAVREGWNQGVDQANLILDNAMSRMNRDYRGMLLFHTFVMQGKITMPAIASESIAITKDGNSVSVDETLLRITTLSDFNIRLSDWKAGVRSTDTPSQVTLQPLSGRVNQTVITPSK